MNSFFVVQRVRLLWIFVWRGKYPRNVVYNREENDRIGVNWRKNEVVSSDDE